MKSARANPAWLSWTPVALPVETGPSIPAKMFTLSAPMVSVVMLFALAVVPSVSETFWAAVAWIDMLPVTVTKPLMSIFNVPDAFTIFWLKAMSTEVEPLVATVSLPPASFVKSTTLLPSLLPLTETERSVALNLIEEGKPTGTNAPAVVFKPK